MGKLAYGFVRYLVDWGDNIFLALFVGGNTLGLFYAALELATTGDTNFIITNYQSNPLLYALPS